MKQYFTVEHVSFFVQKRFLLDNLADFTVKLNMHKKVKVNRHKF